MMVFKAEFMRKNSDEFKDLYYRLQIIKKNMEQAYNLIHENKMREGRKKIIELNKDYSELFEEMNKIVKII